MARATSRKWYHARPIAGLFLQEKIAKVCLTHNFDRSSLCESISKTGLEMIIVAFGLYEKRNNDMLKV